MLKYEYKNAVIHIEKPTEEQLINIRKSTEIFLQRILKERNRNDIK